MKKLLSDSTFDNQYLILLASPLYLCLSNELEQDYTVGQRH